MNTIEKLNTIKGLKCWDCYYAPTSGKFCHEEKKKVSDGTKACNWTKERLASEALTIGHTDPRFKGWDNGIGRGIIA